MKVLLAAINAKYIHSNLGIYSLKTYGEKMLKEWGLAEQAEISLAEYTINHQMEQILQDIYKRKPDVIGFSCYIWNISYVKMILADIKKVLPDVKIWAGGPEVSYHGEAFLKEEPAVDLVMMGEGEITFAHFLKALLEGEDLKQVPGLMVRNADGTFTNTGFRQVMDMSQIPFPYAFMDMKELEHRIIYYESSRGCPFSCAYCLSSIDKKLRFRSLDLVLPELEWFLQAKVPQVKFVDRTFNCKKSYAMAIWQYIRDHDNGVTNFHFEIAADLLDKDELDLLSTMRPGLVQLEIGVQSTNEKTLEAIRRKTDIEEIREITETINSWHNIHQHLDLIAGLPWEDLESFKKSFNDVYEMEPEQLQLGFLKVLKGSYMEELIPDCDLLYSAAPPYEVLCTKWLSYGDVLELKDIEEMTEVHYNSRQFTCTLKELEKEFDTPYEMFSFMAGYYNKNHLFGISHSRIARYEILWKIIQERLEKNGKCETQAMAENVNISEKLELYRDLLMTDLCLRENVKSRPTFARDLSSSKDFVREFFQKEEKTPEHLSGYEGYDSRQMAKMAHLEPLRDGTYLLFDYKKRDPLSYNARTVRV
uniref:B12-binding domain-containing radical SAM protein n=1 Tax=Enterocloster sp. TaxID=2719315 RepID=UPI003FEE1CB5